MASTSFEPTWQWPGNIPGRWSDEHEQEQPRQRHTTTGTNPDTQESGKQPDRQNAQPGQRPTEEQQQRHYGPRTCRICLETVLPSFEPGEEGIAGVFQGAPKVTYRSPDGGRLIRPCLCRGSQKFVHEECLTAWRLQDPTNKRNYWQCPTCRYSYRLERMTWARWISGTGMIWTGGCSMIPMLMICSRSDHFNPHDIPDRHVRLGLYC